MNKPEDDSLDQLELLELCLQLLELELVGLLQPRTDRSKHYKISKEVITTKLHQLDSLSQSNQYQSNF